MKSRAMVVTEPGRMEMEAFELVTPPADHVLLKTTVTSVCSTDVKVFHGHTPVGKYPIVMGHEVAGEVVEMGAEAKDWYDVRPGDRVTIEPYLSCGRCAHSRSDHFYHHCPHGGIYGITLPCDTPPHLFGGYSEYLYLVPGTILHRQHEGIADSAASISSVVANGVRWVKTLGQVSFGESVVISGPGSQGLCSLAAALQAGASPVIVLGLECDRGRLLLAEEFGAHHVINVEATDPLQEITRMCPSGVDAVIETSGTPAGIRTAIGLTRPGGRIVTIGLSGGIETPVVFDDLVWRSISLISGLGQAGNVGDAMKLIETQRFPFEKINTHTYRLDELEQAIADTENRPPGFIKGAVLF